MRGVKVGVGALVLGAVLGGCTSVRVMQREGCWVRQKEHWLGQVEEEMGPCARPQPAWVEDRLTRLVQECVAQSDYRWQTQALEAWRRGQPMPAQPSEENTLQACMSEAARVVVTENETLKTRLAEVSGDRAELKSTVEVDQRHLRDSHDRIATALGEAAKKPAPSAVATATSTSDGSATTQSDSTSHTPQAPAVYTPAPVSLSVAVEPRPEPKATQTRVAQRKAPKATAACAPEAKPTRTAKAPAPATPACAPQAPAPVTPACAPQAPATGADGSAGKMQVKEVAAPANPGAPVVPIPTAPAGGESEQTE